jgi:hypothetical protein
MAAVESFPQGHAAVKAECAGKSVFFRESSMHEVVDLNEYRSNNSVS